jgi:hypothetical protein
MQFTVKSRYGDIQGDSKRTPQLLAVVQNTEKYKKIGKNFFPSFN